MELSPIPPCDKVFEVVKPTLEMIDPVMFECDPEAVTALQLEIAELSEQGIDISVGHTPDSAYEDPEKIREIYTYLHEMDIILADAHQTQQRALRMGSVATGPRDIVARLFSRRVRDHALRVHEEQIREELLFGSGEGKTDSMPWHRQRGRALALATIASAHELKAGDGENGRYSSMSGPVHERLLQYQFSGGWLDGYSLHDAVVATEMKFGKKSLGVASIRADRRIADVDEFVHGRTTPEFKKVVQYCVDSLGIRSRKEEVNQAVSQQVAQLVHEKGRDADSVLIMSFGCGTALPILEGMQALKQEYGSSPQIILIDQDPIALAAATCLAEDMGLSDSIELHCERLFSRIGSPMDFESVLRGRKVDIAEDSGLREYLPDPLYKKLTKVIWSKLAKGGLMSTGNMNIHRPQAEFLHGMMGWWPHVQMRSIEQSLSLHRRAGIPPSHTRARVTRDGVYTLFFSQK